MPTYLTSTDVQAMNDAIMERMGGTSALRDQGALDSAVMRPQMAAHYEHADLAMQAAKLIVGIALAHAFVDGNKRTALAAGTAFLIMNGQWVRSQPADLGRQIIGVLTRTGTLDEATAEFATWLNEHMQDI